MNRPERDINPGWFRTADWPYKEDWDSETWKERMHKVHLEGQALRAKHGFIFCPKCETGHTNYTIWCRGCGYRVLKDEAAKGSES
jgi:hypothetical protein